MSSLRALWGLLSNMCGFSVVFVLFCDKGLAVSLRLVSNSWAPYPARISLLTNWQAHTTMSTYNLSFGKCVIATLIVMGV